MFGRFKRQIKARAHRRKVAKEQQPWLDIGEPDFWLLARQDLVAQKLYIQRHASTQDWFSETEIKQRRNQLAKTEVSTHSNGDPHQLTGRAWYKPTSWMRRNASPNNAQNEESSADRASVFRPLRNISQVLFDPFALKNKLKQPLLQLDRRFRGKMKASLKSFKHYQHIVQHLPADDVERQIDELKNNYLASGLRREWYTAYKEMVEKVVRESLHSSLIDGQNEPAARILQQDFLQTMQSRVSTYRRFQELRATCFERGMTNEIDLLERTRGRIGTGERLIRDPVDYSAITSLVELLEDRVNQATREERAEARIIEPLDPAERIADWQSYQQLLRTIKVGGKTLIERLVPIVQQHQGWRLAFNVFRAENRLANARTDTRIDSTKLKAFISQITARIERELPVDLEFQQFCELHRDNEAIQGQLQETLAAIKLEYAMHGADALDTVHDLKVAFLSEQRSTQDNVMPLFRK